MKRGLRLVGVAVGTVVALVVLLALTLYVVGSSKITQSLAIEGTKLNLHTDSATIARGAHLARIHGCTDCHGTDLSGRIFADEPPFRVVATNLTSGAGGVGGQYTAELFERAIRHGIGADGRLLQIMPAKAFHNLGDADAADLIAYLQQLPPVDRELPSTAFKPLGRILAAFAIDPTAEVSLGPARGEAPAPGAEEYGAYLTSITCAYCHGPDLRGGESPVPGAPPAPDLAAAGRLSFGDFAQTLRTGVTVGGHEINPEFMPWTAFANMTDEELRAIHNHLASLTGATPTAPASAAAPGK